MVALVGIGRLHMAAGGATSTFKLRPLLLLSTGEVPLVAAAAAGLLSSGPGPSDSGSQWPAVHCLERRRPAERCRSRSRSPTSIFPLYIWASSHAARQADSDVPSVA
jgi:hypothetical protein